MAELGLRQRELSNGRRPQAIVREIQRNTVQRQRGMRTLEALSAALDWHPEHLTAVLIRPTTTGTRRTGHHGRPRPAVGHRTTPGRDQPPTRQLESMMTIT